MNERIKQIRQSAELTQEQFAEIIGVTPTYVFMLEKGLREPSLRVAKIICLRFNISDAWMQTGEGDMYSSQSANQKLAAFFSQIMSEPDDSPIKELLCTLADMSQNDLQKVTSFLDLVRRK